MIPYKVHKDGLTSISFEINLDLLQILETKKDLANYFFFICATGFAREYKVLLNKTRDKKYLLKSHDGIIRGIPKKEFFKFMKRFFISKNAMHKHKEGFFSSMFVQSSTDEYFSIYSIKKFEKEALIQSGRNSLRAISFPVYMDKNKNVTLSSFRRKIIEALIEIPKFVEKGNKIVHTQFAFETIARLAKTTKERVSQVVQDMYDNDFGTKMYAFSEVPERVAMLRKIAEDIPFLSSVKRYKNGEKKAYWMTGLVYNPKSPKKIKLKVYKDGRTLVFSNVENRSGRLRSRIYPNFAGGVRTERAHWHIQRLGALPYGSMSYDSGYATLVAASGLREAVAIADQCLTGKYSNVKHVCIITKKTKKVKEKEEVLTKKEEAVIQKSQYEAAKPLHGPMLV